MRLGIWSHCVTVFGSKFGLVASRDQTGSPHSQYPVTQDKCSPHLATGMMGIYGNDGNFIDLDDGAIYRKTHEHPIFDGKKM